MAKISARGAREVARLRTARKVEDMECEDLWVVRSDRKVLVRSARINGRVTSGTYRVLGTLSEAAMADPLRILTSYATRNGDRVI